jgi:GDP-4-dehydro-6-deoxy-D-mannose reductase
MRLFITGIGGFVGSHLARHALERGDRVSGTYLDTPAKSVAPEEVDQREVDLLDLPALTAAVAEAAPEAVIHLAGLSHVGDSWNRMADYFRVNVLGTENLLAVVREAAPEARVVVASSSEVYGRVPEDLQPIREDRPVDPRTPYALTKAAAERLALAGSKRAVIVRSFNLIGPGQSERFALPAFARQLAAIRRGEQNPVLSVGNLTALRDFVHVADGAAAYRLLAETGEPGAAYNLATGRAVSIAHALDRLLAVSGVEARVEQAPERLRPVDLPLLSGNNERLCALGWAPRHTLDEAVRDLWRVTLELADDVPAGAGMRGGDSRDGGGSGKPGR